MHRAIRKTFCLLLLGAFLAGCSSTNEEPSLDEYVSTLSWKDGFKVLQLTDQHFSAETNLERAFSYMNAVVSYAEPDLLMLTGDTFMLATLDVVKEVYDHIRSLGIPYAIAWGNHDMGCPVKPSELERLAKGGNSCFRDPKSSKVSGDSNYVIRLEKEGRSVYDLYVFDSHGLAPDGPFHSKYRPLDEGQVDWFASLADGNKQEGSYVPSLAYFHIPQKFVATAYADESLRTYSKWDIHESISTPKEDSSLLSVGKTHGLRGMFYGHDHGNDYVCDYDGMTLGFGVKTGHGLYYKTARGMDLIGGSLVTLREGGSFFLEHLYVQDTAGYPLTRESYQ